MLQMPRFLCHQNVGFPEEYTKRENLWSFWKRKAVTTLMPLSVSSEGREGRGEVLAIFRFFSALSMEWALTFWETAMVKTPKHLELCIMESEFDMIGSECPPKGHFIIKTILKLGLMYFVPNPMLGIKPRGLAHAREVLSHPAAPSSPSFEHTASILSQGLSRRVQARRMWHSQLMALYSLIRGGGGEIGIDLLHERKERLGSIR